MSLISIFESTSFGLSPRAPYTSPGPAVSQISRAGDTSPRTDSKVEASTPSRAHVGAGVWAECDERSGVMQIHDPRLFRPGLEPFCRALADRAVQAFGALRAEICMDSSICRLEFGPEELDRAEIVRRSAAALRAATSAIPHPDGWLRGPEENCGTDSGSVAVETGAMIGRREGVCERPAAVEIAQVSADNSASEPEVAPRVAEVLVAAGAFTMAVAGAVLPGIPSLPFLLVAARHAIRISPTIERSLSGRPWSAEFMRRLEGSGGLLQPDWRSCLRMLLIAAVAVAVMVIVSPPLPFVIGLEIGVAAVVCLREMGGPGDQNAAMGVPA